MQMQCSHNVQWVYGLSVVLFIDLCFHKKKKKNAKSKALGICILYDDPMNMSFIDFFVVLFYRQIEKELFFNVAKFDQFLIDLKNSSDYGNHRVT